MLRPSTSRPISNYRDQIQGFKFTPILTSTIFCQAQHIPRQKSCRIIVVNRVRAFRVGSGSGLNLENLSGFNQADAEVKSRFSVSDRVFAMAELSKENTLSHVLAFENGD